MTGVAFSGDGRSLATKGGADRESGAILWDNARQEVIAKFGDWDRGGNVAFTCDDRVLHITHEGGRLDRVPISADFQRTELCRRVNRNLSAARR